jgi:crotonobetainyl-CoA:carnitine CoA-transferase CaiB-like acyl-CoA transferase
MHFNAGKRVISLNLKTPDARQIMARLLDTSDVFVSNMRPDALARLGLDPDSVRAERPRLVHCTITGFGPGGPYRGRAAYDSALQGASGIAGLFSRRDGLPKYAPLLICDHVVGEIAAGAIMSALFERERTGLGTKLEVPMYETMAAFVLQEHLGPKTFEPALGPVGDTRILNPDNRPLKTADGWISLTANTDAQTRAFLKIIGREDAIDDPRFLTTTDRYRHVDEWFALRNDALKTRTTAEWLDLFGRCDIPAMPCHTLDTLLDDPHLSAVKLVEDDIHPTEGHVRGIRPTILNGDATGPMGTAARPLGWDTRSVLSDIGYSGREIEQFLSSSVAKVHESVSHYAEMEPSS